MKLFFNEVYVKNLLDVVKEKLKKVVEDKKVVNFVIVGDEVFLFEKGVWVVKLMVNLEIVYGKGLWNVIIKEYKGESIEELIVNKCDKEIVKDNLDVILFELLFIIDNGKIGNGNFVVNI